MGTELKKLFEKYFRNKLNSALNSLFKEGLNLHKNAANLALIFNKILMKKAFKSAKNYVKILLLKKILRKKLRKHKTNSNSYGFSFKIWKESTILKLNDYANRLINLFKQFICKKKVLKSTKGSEFLNKRLMILSDHFKRRKRINYEKWKVNTKLSALNQNAQLIQSFARIPFSKNLLRILRFNQKIHYLYRKNELKSILDLGLHLERLRFRMGLMNCELQDKLIVNNILKAFKRSMKTEKLRLIIMSQDDQNSKKNLRKFLSFWKFFLTKFENSLLKIQTNARIFLAKNIFLRLVKKAQSLSKIVSDKINKTVRNKSQILSILIKKWLYKSMLLMVTDKTIIIQKRIRCKVAKERKEKLKALDSLRGLLNTFIIREGILGRFKKIDSLGKFQRYLIKALLRPVLQKIYEKDKLNNKLKDILLVSNKRNMDYLIKEFFRMWRNFIEITLDKENNASGVITSLLRICVTKNRIKKLLNRKKVIHNLITKLYLQQEQKVKCMFSKWRQISLLEDMNISAYTIQSFFKCKLISQTFRSKRKFTSLAFKILRKQVLSRLIFRRKLNNKLNNLLPIIIRRIYLRFFESLNNSGNNSEFYKTLYKTVKNNLRTTNEEIMRRIKMKSILTLRFQKTLAEKYRSHLVKRIKIEKFKNIFGKLLHSEDKKITIFLLKWCSLNNFLKLKESSKIIENFLIKRLNNQRWTRFHKFNKLIKMMNAEKKILVELRQFRISFALLVAINKLIKHIQKHFLNKLRINRTKDNYFLGVRGLDKFLMRINRESLDLLIENWKNKV